MFSKKVFKKSGIQETLNLLTNAGSVTIALKKKKINVGISLFFFFSVQFFLGGGLTFFLCEGQQFFLCLKTFF